MEDPNALLFLFSPTNSQRFHYLHNIELNLNRQLSPPAMILISLHAFVIILLVILCVATGVSFDASVGLKIFRYEFSYYIAVQWTGYSLCKGARYNHGILPKKKSRTRALVSPHLESSKSLPPALFLTRSQMLLLPSPYRQHHPHNTLLVQYSGSKITDGCQKVIPNQGALGPCI